MSRQKLEQIAEEIIEMMGLMKTPPLIPTHEPSNPRADDLAIIFVERTQQQPVRVSSENSFRFFECPQYDPQRIMRETIAALQGYEVTEELIRNNWHSSSSDVFALYSWGDACKFTLLYLITGQPNNSSDMPSNPLPLESRLSPINALREMSGLCGLRTSALQKLYSFGVKGDHLKLLRGEGDLDLMAGRCHALEHLVRQGTPILDSINQVNEMTLDEAWDINGTHMFRVD